jgi:hypothetical protein
MSAGEYYKATLKGVRISIFYVDLEEEMFIKNGKLTSYAPLG